MKLRLVNPFTLLKRKDRTYFFLIVVLSLALIALAVVELALNSPLLVGIAFFAYVILGEISNIFIAYLTQSFFEN